jgi:acetate kinase
LDTLVFSGGIGENAAPLRRRICMGMEFLGIDIDERANGCHASVISAGGTVAVRVIRTDEESVIAALSIQVLGLGSK